jgi:hypothetical protein
MREHKMRLLVGGFERARESNMALNCTADLVIREQGKCGDCSMSEHRSNTRDWSLSLSRADVVHLKKVTSENTHRFTRPNSTARCKAKLCQWGEVAASEAKQQPVTHDSLQRCAILMWTQVSVLQVHLACCY